MPRNHHSVLCKATFALCLCALSCTRRDGEQLKTTSRTADSSSVSVPEYPRGRWRLAAPNRVATTVLWLSHILIRHDAVKTTQAPCSLLPWHPPFQPSHRSRAAALGLAYDIAAKAALDPNGFADLAQKYSDDDSTRPQGGSLGGLAAISFMPTESVLDAVALLHPGQVSPPVDTAQGFEIFYRRERPAQVEVSGARIVIGYEGADWLQKEGGPVVARTRDQAFEKARAVFLEAQREPDRFGDLMAEHSEHPDKMRGGDFGTWSTLQPIMFAREVEVLSQLETGQIASPIDSPQGVEIIQRTPAVQRPVYAAQVVQIPFEADDPSSKQQARAKATELASLLQQQPEQMSAVQQSYCCRSPLRWLDGRNDPQFTEAVKHLELNQVARAPVEQPDQYVILRRIDPDPIPPPPGPEFELPAPSRPDLEALAQEFPDDAMQATLWSASTALGMALDGAKARALRAASTFIPDPADHAQEPGTFQSALEKVKAFLSDAEYDKYRALVEQQFERLLLAQG